MRATIVTLSRKYIYFFYKSKVQILWEKVQHQIARLSSKNS